MRPGGAFPLFGADGAYTWFLSRAAPIRDSGGTIVRWFGTCTDISAQVTAEERIRSLNTQLQERLAELEAIMQVLPVGVAVSQDAQSRVVTANSALARILSISPHENIADVMTSTQGLLEFCKDGRPLAPADHLCFAPLSQAKPQAVLSLRFAVPRQINTRPGQRKPAMFDHDNQSAWCGGRYSSTLPTASSLNTSSLNAPI